MALKDTVHHMKTLLMNICKDLEKASGGNKAASQRVRTQTIKLEKVAKMYRKESVTAEKKSGKAPKAAKKHAPKAAKKAHKKAKKR